ncbi:MAG: hypothetical protein WBE45_11015 [Terriglobales bacterium]
MSLEKLEPTDVGAVIVFVDEATPDQPHFLRVEVEGEAADECKRKVLEQLWGKGMYAVGMLFRQFDAKEKRQTTFPYQFTGLSESAIAVLKKAAEMQLSKQGAFSA